MDKDYIFRKILTKYYFSLAIIVVFKYLLDFININFINNRYLFGFSSFLCMACFICVQFICQRKARMTKEEKSVFLLKLWGFSIIVMLFFLLFITDGLPLSNVSSDIDVYNNISGICHLILFGTTLTQVLFITGVYLSDNVIKLYSIIVLIIHLIFGGFYCYDLLSGIFIAGIEFILIIISFMFMTIKSMY